MNDINISPNKVAKLLFVDDEPNVLKSLHRLFRSPEYEIHLAESGMAGLEVLKAHDIDLIISDMRMPQMDGAEFLTLAAESWPDTLRILLTGYADISSTIAAVNQGRIYQYCTKPWEDTELKSLVNNALEQKRMREERKQLFEIINQQNQQLNEININLELKVEKRTDQLRKSLVSIEHANEALQRQYIDSVKVFAKIIEMRPGIKSGHAKYIAEKAKDIAMRINMDSKQIKDLVFAGLLLQIGKISLPDSLLTKAQFSMTSLEKNQFFNHAKEGQNLLNSIELLHNAAELISYQYEYFNGSGHPHGFVGQEIPLGARILSVVRDYITYLDGSITGKPMTTNQVKMHLSSKKNLYYDPNVVDVFLALLTEAEAEANSDRPIVEISWTQLQPGMEVAEILSNDLLYIKDTILTEKLIDDILNLRQHGKSLTFRIRLGSLEHKK
ncbi:HD domain-containing phosphohydrolase [Methylomonas sp. AM2-LC]|uniref:HD domain-containing phosphohydrolase n=1 Tax=Methylomonas sp. AM2-LC TaxID=3153301 RepID=UPI0032631A04